MVKKLLALVTALVMLAAFMPCAFAEGEYKVYYDEDFEGTTYDFGLNSKPIVDGDDVNTTKYVSISSGQIDVKYSAVIPVNGTVVEFRSKYYGTNTYSNMTFIQGSWEKTKDISITDLAAKEWTWFRIVFPESGDNNTFSVYKSSNKVTWSKATLGSTVSTTIDLTSIKQIRINACLLDDFIVYTNGSAPTATAYSITPSLPIHSLHCSQSDLSKLQI